MLVNPWAWPYINRIVNDDFFTEFSEVKRPEIDACPNDLHRYENRIPMRIMAYYRHPQDPYANSETRLLSKDDRLVITVDVAPTGTGLYYVEGVSVEVNSGLYDLRIPDDNCFGCANTVAELLDRCTVSRAECELCEIINRINATFRDGRFHASRDERHCLLTVKNRKHKQGSLHRYIININVLLQRIELSHAFLEIFIDPCFMQPTGLDESERCALRFIMSFADVAHYVGYEALKERALERACEARRYGWSHCNFKREHEQLRLAVKRHIDQLPMRMPDMNAARILEDEDMLDSGCPF